jgi:putative oxidoreductase
MAIDLHPLIERLRGPVGAPESYPSQSLFQSVIATVRDPGTALVRFVLGVVMLAHACQGVFGFFGGAGWSGTLRHFRDGLHLPAAIAVAVLLTELLGSLGLVVGFLGRVSALGILCVMIGAVLIVHAPNGFFMNWSGTNAGEGFEYHLLVMAMTVLVLLRGSGSWSVDAALMEPPFGQMRHPEGEAHPEAQP